MRGCKHTCLLAEQSRGKNFILYKPNIGKQSQPESLDSLQKKYRRVGGGCGQPRGEREKPLSPGRAGFGGTLTTAPWSPVVGWAELLVTPGCPDSQPWISHLSYMLGSRKSPTPSVPSAGAARGSQGALGEQLPLLPDALQPRHLVRHPQPPGRAAAGGPWRWGRSRRVDPVLNRLLSPVWRKGTGAAGCGRRGRSASRARACGTTTCCAGPCCASGAASPASWQMSPTAATCRSCASRPRRRRNKSVGEALGRGSGEQDA